METPVSLNNAKSHCDGDKQEAFQAQVLAPTYDWAERRRKVAAKLLIYTILAVAVIAMSSGGVWFALLPETPPLMKACWRLTVTTLVQCFGLAYQLRSAGPRLQRVWLAEFGWMAASGLSLGVHFASWSWSIDHTSLTHSLLFVCTTPLLIVAWMGLRYGLAMLRTRVAGPGRGRDTPADQGHVSPIVLAVDGATVSLPASTAVAPPLPSSAVTSPSRLSLWVAQAFDPAHALPPTALETAGALLGFLGAGVLISFAGEKSGHGEGLETSVTLAGDLAALLGAFTVWGYLEVGAVLRRGKEPLPLFLYATPVTAVGAVVCAVGSAIVEPTARFEGVGPTALFGWLGDGRRFGLTLGAAVGSGILGHTAANYCLRDINPLIVSVALLWEPLFGSFMGWAAGVSGVPGLATLLAGPLLLLGAFLVTIGARDSGFSWAKLKQALGWGTGAATVQQLA